MVITVLSLIIIVLSIYNYNRIELRDIYQEITDISNTPYYLQFSSKDNFILKNKINKDINKDLSLDIKRFAVLNYNNKIYLILSTSPITDGTHNGYYFEIYDITTNNIIDKSPTDRLLLGACEDPLLRGSSLLFRDADHCDFYPIFVSDRRPDYYLKLN